MQSAVSPSQTVGNALGPPILIILLLFGGFYINSGSLPEGSTWIQYISFLAWGFKVSRRVHRMIIIYSFRMTFEYLLLFILMIEGAGNQ